MKTEFNTVTCGMCGSEFSHEVGAVELTCPSCKFTSEPCDFPDKVITNYFGLTVEQMKAVESLISMINSCYAYDQYEVGTYSYEKYIVPRGAVLGDELFKLCYELRIAELKENYTVKRGVYEDREGCSYNSLVRKEKIQCFKCNNVQEASEDNRYCNKCSTLID